MHTLIGTLVIVATVAALLVMLWKGKVTASCIWAIGSIGVAGGFAIANLTAITTFQIAPEGISADIKRDVETVRAKTEEVRGIEERLGHLAANVNSVEKRVKTSENRVLALLDDADQTRDRVDQVAKQAVAGAEEVQSVAEDVRQMQGNMRQTWRSLLESYALAIGTRNIFPTPPEVATEIDRHLNALAAFAYPDEEERRRETARIMEMIKAAQPGE